ncbi:MAG: fibronectin type III domain-containing protein [Flavobacteriaceae bacterium]
MRPQPYLKTLCFCSLGIIVFSIFCCSGDDAPDTTPPGDVENLAFEIGDRQISLSWDAPTDDDLEAFTIAYTPNGPATPIRLNSQTTSYTVSDLENRTQYSFTVKAEDRAGNQSFGITLNATPQSADLREGALFVEDFETACIPTVEIGADGLTVDVYDVTSSGWQIFSASTDQRIANGNPLNLWDCLEILNNREVGGINASSPDNLAITISHRVEIPNYRPHEAMDDWLISPQISLEGTDPYTLYFDYTYYYADQEGYGFHLYVSTDYDGGGDPTTATWTLIEVPLVKNDFEEYPIDFFQNQANVSLADFTGQSVYLGIYMNSSGQTSTSGSELSIDNIIVTTVQLE